MRLGLHLAAFFHNANLFLWHMKCEVNNKRQARLSAVRGMYYVTRK
jgi:hypothetical protein